MTLAWGMRYIDEIRDGAVTCRIAQMRRWLRKHVMRLAPDPGIWTIHSDAHHTRVASRMPLTTPSHLESEYEPEHKTEGAAANRVHNRAHRPD